MVMQRVFWDNKGSITIDFHEKDATVEGFLLPIPKPKFTSFIEWPEYLGHYDAFNYKVKSKNNSNR